jgi:hypothetical protein
MDSLVDTDMDIHTRLPSSCRQCLKGERIDSWCSLYKWRGEVRSGELISGDGKVVPLKAGPVDLANEVNRLRRELANAKLDLEIVKKRE